MGNEAIERNDLPLLLGVMGDPIVQSKSPVMQGAAFQAAGLAANYIYLHVSRELLEDAVKGLRALGFRGANVTVPHKVEVMRYLDEVDEAARQIGAVNTIVNEGGRLIGYNTDGIGYIRSLKEEAVADLKGKRVLVLGAGGAARGIVYSLLQEQPEHVIVANRTEEKARELASEWSQLGSISGCGISDLGRLIQESRVDILINTTSVGMHPNTDNTPLPSQWLSPNMVVSDLIYNPLKTNLLLQAEAIGCKIHNGLGMFVYQGAYAFEYWTGEKAPISAMRSVVLNSLPS